MGNDPILTLSQSVVLNLYTMDTIELAPVPGLEPRTTESKSVVLPLHHTGSK